MVSLVNRMWFVLQLNFPGKTETFKDSHIKLIRDQTYTRVLNSWMTTVSYFYLFSFHSSQNVAHLFHTVHDWYKVRVCVNMYRLMHYVKNGWNYKF